ncbi:hypothetical protein FY140_12935 [Agrobacterium tumefaciens]|uniref:hypothetical protein n=1 Tax=Agrobacterium tumefaciens TaxID=358 RepID=UPI0021D13B74|nr:hypothetical protein [Agrobacterium tumefaciens]UXT21674.1 hypothetical protein FY140_12935 [Agrobacterium tumefaciens]
MCKTPSLMQCFQLAKREHCKARIAKGELTWRMEKPKKTGIKNIRKTCCRIAARNAAERRMNMSTTGIIRPKSDIATQNGASQPCVQFSEHFFRWRNT